MTVRSDCVTDFQAAAFDSASGLARTVTYEGAAIDGLLTYGNDPQVERSAMNLGGGLRYLSQRAILTVSEADVSQPQEGDTWVLGGVTWTVQAISHGEMGCWILDCYRSPRAMAKG